MRRLALIGLVLLVAACGQRRDLSPPAGATMPPKPAEAKVTPSTEDMLEIPVQAGLDRVDDPLRRSRDRADDPFDLPPE